MKKNNVFNFRELHNSGNDGDYVSFLSFFRLFLKKFYPRNAFFESSKSDSLIVFTICYNGKDIFETDSLSSAITFARHFVSEDTLHYSGYVEISHLGLALGCKVDIVDFATNCFYLPNYHF